MNCVNHADVQNTAFCIKCGKPLCDQCVRKVQNSIYCEHCLSDSLSPPPVASTGTVGGSSPEAAFLLGLIPGVGAIYNGEYFKAAFNLLIFASLVTLADDSGGHSGEGLFVICSLAFYFYMAFEAYYTAKKKKLAREGVNLITPFDELNEQLGLTGNMELWGGVVLVVIGALFLLDNFRILSLEQVKRFWPLLMVAAGVFLIRRFRRKKA